MDDLQVERVLRLAEGIPPGAVVSYGDIATVLGMGPRQVGQVMARWGSDVPWWRVTSAAGDLPPELLARARPHWRREQIPEKTNGRGCRLAQCRWPAPELARAARRVTDELNTAAATAEC
ncbi:MULTISPECIES: MGMT family protein [unclassified Luteococcus]|uniref:MGMT family protein n=1 Tax=unclassified Luteococcus TaxID=2639923 RepID=UPI00313C4280